MTGREKDVIIKGGQNLLPDVIEEIARSIDGRVGVSIREISTGVEIGYNADEPLPMASTCKVPIDHIVPCAAFDMRKESDRLACFHYTNLRALWSHLNIEKGATWKGINYQRERRVTKNALR